MRKKIKIFIFFLIAFFTMQSFACAEVLEFAQISDVHYSLNNSELDRYLYFLSVSLRKKNPDFAVFLGDNVDKSREEDVIGFMRAVHAIKTPYYIALGNNDAHGLRGVEKNIYFDIVSTFNRNQDEKKYYYFKPDNHFVCVVLDDTPDFAPSNHGEITEEQLVWLDNLLTKYSKRLFIIFHHSPVLPPRDDYKLSMLNSEKYQNVLDKHSNVLIISSGHYHQESILKDKNGVRHISAPAFIDIPHSYQLIKIIYDEKTLTSPKDIEIVVTKVKV